MIPAFDGLFGSLFPKTHGEFLEAVRSKSRMTYTDGDNSNRISMLNNDNRVIVIEHAIRDEMLEVCNKSYLAFALNSFQGFYSAFVGMDKDANIDKHMAAIMLSINCKYEDLPKYIGVLAKTYLEIPGTIDVDDCWRPSAKAYLDALEAFETTGEGECPSESVKRIWTLVNNRLNSVVHNYKCNKPGYLQPCVTLVSESDITYVFTTLPVVPAIGNYVFNFSNNFEMGDPLFIDLQGSISDKMSDIELVDTALDHLLKSHMSCRIDNVDKRYGDDYNGAGIDRSLFGHYLYSRLMPVPKGFENITVSCAGHTGVSIHHRVTLSGYWDKVDPDSFQPYKLDGYHSTNKLHCLLNKVLTPMSLDNMSSLDHVILQWVVGSAFLHTVYNDILSDHMSDPDKIKKFMRSFKTELLTAVGIERELFGKSFDGTLHPGMQLTKGYHYDLAEKLITNEDSWLWQDRMLSPMPGRTMPKFIMNQIRHNDVIRDGHANACTFMAGDDPLRPTLVTVYHNNGIVDTEEARDMTQRARSLINDASKRFRDR